jgi:RNA polymerase sigma factor (TIGR02999 family)
VTLPSEFAAAALETLVPTGLATLPFDRARPPLHHERTLETNVRAPVGQVRRPWPNPHPVPKISQHPAHGTTPKLGLDDALGGICNNSEGPFTHYPPGHVRMSEVTQLLNALSRGDGEAADQLLPLVYEELRRLAAGYLDQERPGQTLQPTALVHEAFLRLVGNDVDAQWQGRTHFLATAALAMRRILIDNARRKQRAKRGGDGKGVELADCPDPRQQEADRLLALDEALTRLAAADACAAELVQLHTFGGLSVEEAGKHLGLSRTAAYRQWAFARAWLRVELGEEDEKNLGRFSSDGA